MSNRHPARSSAVVQYTAWPVRLSCKTISSRRLHEYRMWYCSFSNVLNFECCIMIYMGDLTRKFSPAGYTIAALIVSIGGVLNGWVTETQAGQRAPIPELNLLMSLSSQFRYWIDVRCYNHAKLRTYIWGAFTHYARLYCLDHHVYRRNPCLLRWTARGSEWSAQYRSGRSTALRRGLCPSGGRLSVGNVRRWTSSGWLCGRVVLE